MEISFEIEMARGDIHPVNFTITDGSDPIDFQLDNLYFTVKKDSNDRMPLFQKSLSAGTIFPGEDPGSYGFLIEPVDTNSLPFDKTYECDIEVVAESFNVKKTYFGLLKLTREVTHASNEGVGS